jgi:surfeit locus 1 family protein
LAPAGATDPRRRFPAGLTAAAAIALAILIGLGMWQLRRLAWKEALLARIAQLAHAPAQPIGPVLARARGGQDVDFTRVTADCAGAAQPAPTVFRYALRAGQIGWRVIGACRLAGAPYNGILIDRGLADRFAGAMAPAAASFPAPVAVTGVLRSVGAASLFDAPPQVDGGGVTVVRALDRPILTRLGRLAGLEAPAPYVLAVEAEQPAPPGLRPAALPAEIPNNHLSYALTWFGLAGVLACFYGAKLAEWFRGP